MTAPIDAALRDAIDSLTPDCGAACCPDLAYWIVTLANRFWPGRGSRFLLCDSHMHRLVDHMADTPYDAYRLDLAIEPVSGAV